MKAVILAAGKGTRLGRLTANTPKCLVPVNGRPLLDHQLDALAAAGVADILVVAGYCADQVHAHAGTRFETLVNERYEHSNSIYSLWLAREWVGAGDFVLLNGDVLADPALIIELVDFPAPCATLVDERATCADGEMNVVIRDGRVCAFSKEIRGADASGESGQVTKFGGRESALLFERIEEMVDAGDTDQFPARAYAAIFAGAAMLPVYTAGRWRCEVDTPQDRDHAEQVLAQSARRPRQPVHGAAE